VAAARGLRKSAAKLGVNTALGVAGIALAPPTFFASFMIARAVDVIAPRGLLGRRECCYPLRHRDEEDPADGQIA